MAANRIFPQPFERARPGPSSPILRRRRTVRHRHYVDKGDKRKKADDASPAFASESLLILPTAIYKCDYVTCVTSFELDPGVDQRIADIRQDGAHI